MPEEKHIIWSNIDLDLDDWYDDLHEEYPALGEEGLRDMMYQYNFEYFSDAQSQLDMYVGSSILVLANLGLWDGRHILKLLPEPEKAYLTMFHRQSLAK